MQDRFPRFVQVNQKVHHLLPNEGCTNATVAWLSVSATWVSLLAEPSAVVLPSPTSLTLSPMGVDAEADTAASSSAAVASAPPPCPPRHLDPPHSRSPRYSEPRLYFAALESSGVDLDVCITRINCSGSEIVILVSTPVVLRNALSIAVPIFPQPMTPREIGGVELEPKALAVLSTTALTIFILRGIILHVSTLCYIR